MMEQHQQCNCHQCTWLRADQMSRQLVWTLKPQPAPENKCWCSGEIDHAFHSENERLQHLAHKPEPCGCVYGDRTINPNSCPKHKPSDAVEEKIKEIVIGHKPSCDAMNEFEIALRELVNLARDVK